MAAPVPVAPKVEAVLVALPAEVLELDTHSSSKADPSESSLPLVTAAPMVSPFLCSDDSESDTEMPERHVSSTPHDAMLARWRSRVASRSSSPTTSTSEIPIAPIPPAPSAIVVPSTNIISPVDAPPGIHRRRAILIRPGQDIPIGQLYHTHPGGPCRALTAKKSVGPLPSHRLVLRYTSYHLDRFTSGSSSDHSSSDHSLADHSPANHTSYHSTSDQSLFRHSLPLLPVGMKHRLWLQSPVLSTHFSSTAKSYPSDSPATTLDRHLHLPPHSARPSLKRCRSPATTVPSSIPASGALVPTRDDLLLPRKRFRDFISPEDSIEEDIEANVLAYIKDDATVVEVAADMDVKAEVDAGIGMEVDVRVNIEDEDEGEAESSDRGTMEVQVDVVAKVDIPYGMLMPDAVERLERAESLVASGERAGLLDHVAALEKSNVRLRGTLRMASARVDRFRRHMSFMVGELRQISWFCYYNRMRFRRLEIFAARLIIMTVTCSGMTLEAIEELINQRVMETLAIYEANRAAELVVESQSHNGDDGDNGNGGGNGNRNGGGKGDGNDKGNGNENEGGNRNGNPNKNDRGAMPVARECTYHDFIKCQPLNFKGTEGVVGLTMWFEKMETVFHISNCPERYQLKELMKLMTEVYCPRNEIQKIESELWSPKRRIGLRSSLEVPDNIQGNVIAAKPTRLQDVVRIANNLMDQKLKGYAVKNVENKIRLDNNQRDNHGQQPPVKRHNVRGQNVARAYTAGNNERRGYVGPLPYYNKCKLHHEGQCTVRCSNCKKVGHMARDCKAAVTTTTRGAPETNQNVVTCYECGRQGHYRSDCPKLKNQNRGNKTGNKTNKARGKAYVLGGGEANPDSNVVTGTFLLNNRYAFMLFDSGADRSFVSTTFSALLDVVPSTLDVSHPFNIDLMLVELGSLDVIIGRDWLANHHAVIVCDEKIVRIPYGEEKYIKNGCQTFLAQVTKKEIEDKSEEKRLEDVPIVRDFSEVFPEDLPRLPPTRQVMAISVISVSSDSSEDSVGTPAGRVILFGTIPTTIPDTTPSVIPPTTHIDTTPIPTISPTIPSSPD
ncbi:reverse transcriptase domain-containing protein [Tanacetum coccineum]